MRRKPKREERGRSQYKTVRRKDTRPGYIEGDIPNKAKVRGFRGDSLRSELKAARGPCDQWARRKALIFCNGFIAQLCEPWDQAIADSFFQCFGTLRNTIRGTSLFKLAVLTAEDVKR